jgi:hypothetical protein
MGFTCENAIVIRGGAEAERRAAASLLLAADSIDEDSVSRMDLPSELSLRCASVDGLPEEDISALALQFPSLSFELLYFSKDGEFYGYARRGSGGEAAESADFDEKTLDEVGRRHDGDGIAFARAAFGLAQKGE